MKHMSIAQYAREVERANTMTARISLFFRSLTLRLVMWRTQRWIDRKSR